MNDSLTTPLVPGLPLGPDEPWLAPLAGYSDLPFRLLCREMGAAAACTEMVSAKGLVFGSPGSAPLLATAPGDDPLVVQVFGDDPDMVLRAMDMLLAQGFAWFDLNAGCSVRKVVKTGSGAALLRDPKRLAAVAQAMARLAGPGRCGVKLRLGWAGPGPEARPEARPAACLDIARRLCDAGTAWLTLHPRSAGQGFSGRADLDALARFKAATELPVLASGDLFTAQDAVDCLAATGVDGVMFARGAMADPAVFGRFRDLRRGLPASLPGPAETARVIRRHAELIRAHAPGRRALLRLRSTVPRYVRALPGAREIRMRVALCGSWQELDDIVEELVLAPAPDTTADTTAP